MGAGMSGGKGESGTDYMEMLAPVIADTNKRSKELWREASPGREALLGQFYDFLFGPGAGNAMLNPPQQRGVDRLTVFNDAPTEDRPYWTGETIYPTRPTPMQFTPQSGMFPDVYMPWFKNEKTGVEKLYNQAKSNLIGSTPAGGTRANSFMQLEQGRAQDLASRVSQISSDILNKTWGFTTGAGPQMALQSGSSLLNTLAPLVMNQNNVGMQQENQLAGSKGMMGSGLGQMIGNKFSGGKTPVFGGTTGG